MSVTRVSPLRCLVILSFCVSVSVCLSVCSVVGIKIYIYGPISLPADEL